MAIRVTRQAVEVLHQTRLPARVTRQALEVLWSPPAEEPSIPVIGHPLSEVFGYYRVRQDGAVHVPARDTLRVEGQVDIVDGPLPNMLSLVPGALQVVEATLTGDVTTYVGADSDAFDAANVLLLSGSGSFTIHGLQPPAANRKLLIWAGTGVLTLANDSGGPPAGNRFSLLGDIPLGPGNAAWLFYEDNSARWYARGVNPIPLPNDPTIFGALTAKEEAFVMSSEYLTLSTDDITAVDGIGGNFDLDGSAAPPQWLPSGGDDGVGTAQFDGTERLVVAGLGFVSGDRPSVLWLGQYDDTTDEATSTVVLENDTLTEYIQVGILVTTAADNTYRTLFSLPGFDVLDYGAPEPSDLASHLHEAHQYSTGLSRVFDGTASAVAQTGAINANLTRFSLGATYGGLSAAKVQISEAIFVNNRTPAEMSAYRLLRVSRRYPTVGAALP